MIMYINTKIIKFSATKIWSHTVLTVNRLYVHKSACLPTTSAAASNLLLLHI